MRTEQEEKAYVEGIEAWKNIKPGDELLDVKPLYDDIKAPKQFRAWMKGYWDADENHTEHVTNLLLSGDSPEEVNNFIVKYGL
jgi:hypothetical protein